MPHDFVCPSRADVPPGTTIYRGFTEPGKYFEAAADGDRERHGRDVEHDPGRRGQGSGALDPGRLRPGLRSPAATSLYGAG